MKKKLFILACLICFYLSVSAQKMPEMMDPLPLDPNVRTGILPNGMKYYVRRNGKPEKRAELRLAVNAGSTAETDEQQGLAHFCEHMAFNGTKNFKKNDLINYLESIGTKFGAHLNAYTSFDETVYMIQIPTDNDTIVKKGLQIMEDWAHNVTYDPVEIDKERGVVIEEWRLGLGAQDRMRKKFWPILYKDSRYADRLPIGKKEVLEKCSYEALRSFYRDWYRPDLMAIIAVGDFDPDKMEIQIKDQFGAIPKKDNPKPIKSWEVPDNNQLLTAVATDKEAQFTLVQLMYKQPPEITSNVVEYRRGILEELYNGMINQRLSELTNQEKPPFVFASSNYRQMVRTKDTYSCIARVNPDGIEAGLKALVTENERIKKFGFTYGEFTRMKSELLREMENKFNEREKTESAELASSYVYHFLQGAPVPGAKYDYAMYKYLLPQIVIEEINVLANRWISDGQNAVVIIMGPDNEDVKIPSDERIKQIIKEAQSAPLQRYVDKIATKPLLAAKPTGSKVTSEKEIKELGITTWTLGNGVKINFKPTDFKSDEIEFSAFAFGGNSMVEDKDYVSSAFADGIINESGIAEFDKVTLKKMMQGKIVEVVPEIGEVTQEISGYCSPKDLEIMMQLIYLYFTAPRKDPIGFKTLKNQWTAFVQNKENSPERVFSDTVSYTMSGYNFRNRPPSLSLLEEINHDRAFEIYKERFSDAAGFTFTFVGNVKPEVLKPLVEIYLGGLPSTEKNAAFITREKKTPKGKLNLTVKKGSEPKSNVSLKFNGPFEFNRHNRNEMNALMKLVGIKLRENLREDKGGVYGVGAFPSLQHYPKGTYEITIGFGCAPDNVEKLISAALTEIEDIKQNGCNSINLTKIKETFIRERESYLKENDFWISAISQSEINKENILEILEYNKWVETLKSDDFKRLANKYFNKDEYKRFVLLPEK